MVKPISHAELPEVIIKYLALRESSAAADAADLFAADAVVEDEGRTCKGRDEIREWIRETETKYEYTVTFLDAKVDSQKYVVTNRLQGNFPGSVVELEYQFRLSSKGEIQQLVFA